MNTDDFRIIVRGRRENIAALLSHLGVDQPDDEQQPDAATDLIARLLQPHDPDS